MRKNISRNYSNFVSLKKISRHTCGNEFAAKITEEVVEKPK